MTALMLCYFFPPLGGPAVLRNMAFAKYLPKFGWKPLVISVQPNRRNSIEQEIDSARLEDVADIEVRRCDSIEFAALYAALHRTKLRRILFELERRTPLMHMDYKIGWYPFALREARKVIQSTPVNLIFSTSAPFSAHLIARQLHREFGLPWVADFHDPWTDPWRDGFGKLLPMEGTRFKWHRPHARVDAKLERTVASHADILISNTPFTRRSLIEKYNVPQERVCVLPNGFDSAHFSSGEAQRDGKRFVVTCTGWFYEMRDPGAFFAAYRRLAEAHPNTLLRLVGRYSRAVGNAANAQLRPQTWESSPRVEHVRARQMMRESSVLLANLPEGGEWVPSKIFDYMAAGRPILLIAWPGDAAEIIRQTRAGIVAGPSEEELFAALNYLYQQWQHGFPDWKPSLKEIAKYDRKALTGRLGQIFDSLTQPVVTIRERHPLWGSSS